jgi:hypothetical protein
MGCLEESAWCTRLADTAELEEGEFMLVYAGVVFDAMHCLYVQLRSMSRML